MKPKPLHSLCLFGLLVCLSQGVRAQEAYPLDGAGREVYDAPPVDGETNSHLRMTEPAELADADTSSTGVVRVRPSATPSESAEKQGETEASEESVLGFNFLYYIIQKFKMSDIVDK